MKTRKTEMDTDSRHIALGDNHSFEIEAVYRKKGGKAYVGMEDEKHAVGLHLTIPQMKKVRDALNWAIAYCGG